MGELPSVHFVFTSAEPREQAGSNVHFLPQQSGLFHPDLVAASDAVVGKIGYSTLAEVYHAGIPYGYIPRRRFWESAVLASFVESQMSGLSIAEESFSNGGWIERIPELLAQPRRKQSSMNGAEEIADLMGQFALH